jgi:DNA-binding transcriptional LysR family regulator
MKPHLDRPDLALLVGIREHGSLAAAAESAGVVPSVVTKKLASIEARLGMKLFQRSTRRVVPTADGEAVCERAAALLAQFASLEADLQERHHEPVGRIRIASTFGFGRLWVGPALAEFQRRHPRLEVQLLLTEQLPDLALEGFDGAIWLWSAPGRRASEWTARRLARNQRVLVASPDYVRLRGMPVAPEDLAAHDCLVVRENGQFDVWRLQKDRSEVRVRVHGRLWSNSGEMVRDWCLAGHGIMLRSLWDVAAPLARGELVQVLPGWSMVDADILWLAPHTTSTPRRLRLLVDFLAGRFHGEPWMVRPSAPARPGSRRRR